MEHWIFGPMDNWKGDDDHRCTVVMVDAVDEKLSRSMDTLVSFFVEFWKVHVSGGNNPVRSWWRPGSHGGGGHCEICLLVGLILCWFVSVCYGFYSFGRLVCEEKVVQSGVVRMLAQMMPEVIHNFGFSTFRICIALEQIILRTFIGNLAHDEPDVLYGQVSTALKGVD